MTTLLPIADVRWQLSITANTEDAQIQMLLDAAIDHVERYTGLLLTEREVTETFDRFGVTRLKAWPIAPDAELAITYLDTTGAEQTQSTYRLAAAARPALLLPAIGTAWPAAYCGANSVSVTFTAGYADGEAPASIKQAILLLTRHFYDNRSAVEVGSMNAATELPLGVKGLLQQHRMMTV